ncbi:DUF2142 domain-containing protein [Enterococcus sp. RIT-PI-f]|uniref:DUF2142 domain-containing protein n=1 Tax=Enterococcus sp. RIT-PI-f TaxID=1690244 RepID=UPI003563F880
MKFISRNIAELKGNWKMGIGFLTILLLSQYLLQYKDSTWPKLYILIAAAALLILLSFSRLNKSKQIARNTFLLIAIMGSLNSLIFPVNGNLDEYSHYYHALNLADGELTKRVSQQNFREVSPDYQAISSVPMKKLDGLATNLYNKEFINIRHVPSDYRSELLDISETLANPAYIPSALGISLGRQISDRVAVSYYLGRIGNVLFYAFLAWLAVRVSRYYKIQLFLTSTLPFTLWISAGYTYDNFYYGLTLLLFAQFTNLIKDNNKITIKKIVAYCVTCLGLVFCKAPMLVLIFLPVFIPSKRWETRKNFYSYLLLSFFTLLTSSLWIFREKISMLITPQTAQASLSSIESTTEISRTSYFLDNIGYTIEVFLRSILEIPKNIIEFIEMPQIDIMSTGVLRNVNSISYILLIILASFLLKIVLDKKMILWSLILFLTITLGTIYAISGDTRVFNIGDLHVSGVQGRYHFYLMAFLPLYIKSFTERTSFRNENIAQFLNEEQITNFIVKSVFVITVLNSCIAIYGFL